MVGKKIKNLRKQKGLSQKELGERLGVSGSMISQYESDIRRPKWETMKKFAQALEVSPEYFTDDDDMDKLSYSLMEAILFDKYSAMKLFDKMQLEDVPLFELKLSQLGYYIEYNSSYYLIVEYPGGGTVEMSESEMEGISARVDSFLKFELDEFRKAQEAEKADREREDEQEELEDDF